MAKSKKDETATSKKSKKPKQQDPKQEDLEKDRPQPQRWVLADLQDHNAFFDHLVDMIPSKLYIAGNSGDDYNPKYHKGQHKENRESRRAELKRAKYDPALVETTLQLKKRLEGDHRVLPAPAAAVAVPKKGPAPVATSPTTTADNKSRIEALRAKLHAKIAEKVSNRPAADPSVVSKRAARRAEKQRRKEDAAKKKKSAQTKVESSKGNNGSGSKFTMSLSSAATPAQDLAQIDYSRLTGLNAAIPNYKNNKALANLSSGKNLEKILADAEEKRQKLEELKKSSKEEDKERLAKMQWSDALKEASGERVKDDPAKLKNKLKRKAAKKAKSQKAWKARLEQTQQKMGERQKIRSHNLDQRKLGGKAGANLSKKRIATPQDEDGKKKRLRPGFEGKSHKFLNDTNAKPKGKPNQQ